MRKAVTRSIICLLVPLAIGFSTASQAQDRPKEARQIHQERAYTSPIWYTPEG